MSLQGSAGIHQRRVRRPRLVHGQVWHASAHVRQTVPLLIGDGASPPPPRPIVRLAWPSERLTAAPAAQLPVHGTISIRDVWNFPDGSLTGWSLSGEGFPPSAVERARALGCSVPADTPAQGQEAMAPSVFTLFSQGAVVSA